MTVDATINDPDYTLLDLENARLINGGGIANNAPMVKVGTSGEFTYWAEVRSGVIDGDRANTSNAVKDMEVVGEYDETDEMRTLISNVHIQNTGHRGYVHALRRAVIRYLTVQNSGGNRGIVIGSSDIHTQNIMARSCDNIGIEWSGSWSYNYHQ